MPARETTAYVRLAAVAAVVLIVVVVEGVGNASIQPQQARILRWMLRLAGFGLTTMFLFGRRIDRWATNIVVGADAWLLEDARRERLLRFDGRRMGVRGL